MSVTSLPAHTALGELLNLLCNRRLGDHAYAVVERALLALDDPESYITLYPDDEWLVEGLDLFASEEVSVRLLNWILFDECGEWLIAGDNADAIAERIVDRLAVEGVAVADPPPLSTLHSYCDYFNPGLRTLTKPKALVEFDPGISKQHGVFIVDHRDTPRIAELAHRFALHLNLPA